MKPARHAPRGAYMIPTLLTTGNLVAGCVVLILLLDIGEQAALMCAIAILAGAILDAFDGMVARLTGTTSEFGVEYDSLADFITFGAAPGMLAYEYCLRGLGPVGAVAAVWYVTCTGIRLARFNSMRQDKMTSFRGLPSPAAACTVASFVILVETASKFPPFARGIPPQPWLDQTIAPAFSLMMAALGGLMISRVPYFGFKSVNPTKPRPLRTVMAAVVFIFVAWAQPSLLFGLFLLYIFLGLVLRFLTSVRWAETVAPALVAWAESVSTPRRPPSGGPRDRNADR